MSAYNVIRPTNALYKAYYFHQPPTISMAVQRHYFLKQSTVHGLLVSILVE